MQSLGCSPGSTYADPAHKVLLPGPAIPVHVTEAGQSTHSTSSRPVASGKQYVFFLDCGITSLVCTEDLHQHDSSRAANILAWATYSNSISTDAYKSHQVTTYSLQAQHISCSPLKFKATMFLSLGFVFGLVALAKGQTTLSGQYDCVTQGNYELCNNQWGIGT